MIRSYSYILLFLFFSLLVNAQRNEVYSTQIKSLRIGMQDNWLAPAIIDLNSENKLEISFDELSHDYHRYTYIISHCTADWKLSAIPEIDYLDGFNNNPIEQYETSLNTTVLYTHYSLTIPNDVVKFKISGNYILTVYDDNNNSKPIFKVCFSVIDKKVSISATVTSNTDIDTNKSHQQVSFKVNYGEYDIRNPQSEIKAYVYQNQRVDNKVTDIKPSYINASELTYEHNRDLIFDATNEYRRFETTNVHYATLGVQSIQFHRPFYHVTLYPGEFRTKNYIYDQDQNGHYLVRYDNASNNDIEADYFFVHFSLPNNAPLPGGDLYLQGQFTNNSFNEDTRMKYNPLTNAYESVQFLKQGAYNYQYLLLPNEQGKGTTSLTEGNFYQTENEYLILIYHHPFGARYDQLIGMQQAYYK